MAPTSCSSASHLGSLLPRPPDHSCKHVHVDVFPDLRLFSFVVGVLGHRHVAFGVDGPSTDLGNKPSGGFLVKAEPLLEDGERYLAERLRNEQRDSVADE